MADVSRTSRAFTAMDVFRSGTGRLQLAVAALACILIVVVLSWAYVSFVQVKYEILFADLRPSDAATIVAELDKEKTPYRLGDGGATILAPKDTVAKTRLNLMASSVPLKGTVGFELFNKSDMGLTEFAQQINYQRALSGELARTIMAMDGVDQARVHLALPEHAIFRDDAKPPKASVTILTRPGKALAVDAIRGIQRLVAAAVPDLDVNNVVVLDGRGAVVSDTDAVSPAGSVTSVSPGERRHAIEAFYEGAIRQALRESFPSRRLDVSVSAAFGATPDAYPDGVEAGALIKSTPRSYPLHIRVVADPPVTMPEESAVRNVVFAAARIDPALGDSVTFSANIPVEAAPTARKVIFSLSQGLSPATAWTLACVGVLCVLGALAVALYRRGRATLTETDRTAFADRLRVALAGAEGDGAV